MAVNYRSICFITLAPGLAHSWGCIPPFFVIWFPYLCSQDPCSQVLSLVRSISVWCLWLVHVLPCLFFNLPFWNILIVGRAGQKVSSSVLVIFFSNKSLGSSVGFLDSMGWAIWHSSGQSRPVACHCVACLVAWLFLSGFMRWAEVGPLGVRFVIRGDGGAIISGAGFSCPLGFWWHRVWSRAEAPAL